MSLDWIRCNKCYIGFKAIKVGNSPFSLTQCGHVFCHKCIQKVLDSRKCIECSSTGVQSLELTDPLPGAVKNIFEPFLDICDRMIFAAKFQNTQMMILYKRLEELEKKYYTMKMAYWQQSKKFQELKLAYTQEMKNRKEYLVQNVPSSTAARNYFAPNVFMQHPDVNNANSRHFERLSQRNYHTGYESNDSYLTDSSNTSTVRPVGTAGVPTTPDGMFRIPNLRKVPRSIGAYSHSSGGISSNSGSGRAINNMF